MVEETLPKESESQEIGHLACSAFNAAKPTNWRPKDLEGDDDVGLDKLIQLIEDQKYSTLFYVQVKGCRPSKKEVNIKLSEDGAFFSESLKISTLNYYARIETPVMLAFVDLTVDPNPCKCPVYYQWIDEEIDKLLTDHENLNYLGKKSHTFRIPTKNKLDQKLDVSSYLNKRIALKKATRRIVGSVEEKFPEVETVLPQLASRLSDGCILEAVLQKPEDLWSKASEGTFANSLNKVSKYLEANRGNIASKELGNLQTRLKKASPHEKAEYYHLKAKLITLIGDYKKALNMHRKAQQLMPKEKKYNLAFIEAQANLNYSRPKLCEKLIKETDGKVGIEYTRLRAKLLALSGQPQKGIRLLSGEKEKDVIIVKALIHILSGNYSKCKHACNKGLKRRSLSTKARSILLCMRARVLFVEGMGRDFKGGEIIKFCGIAGMDIKVLKECWSDTLEAWNIASDLGYPTDVDYIIDISSVLSTFFGNADLIFHHLKELAKIRTSSHEVQETLFIMALHLDDKDVVKEQIKKLPPNPAIITGEIMFYYQQGERSRALDIILKNIEKLEKAKSENYDTILLVGAECANEQFKSEELKLLLNKIKLLPNSNDIQACYRFYETISKNVLNKKKAVNELYNAFENGCKDKQIQAQLMMHLNVHEKDDANKLLNVSEEIIRERHLLGREIVRVCEARITLEQWKEALSLLDLSIERFGPTTTFLTMKAVVVDDQGDTAGAIQLLDEVIEKNEFDPRAVEIAAQIAGRCGLADKAKRLYELLLSHDVDSKRKLALLRMLFLLEMRIDPESAQLHRYCEKYGELVDHNDEAEEGLYLQMAFGVSVVNKDKPTEEATAAFQKRLKNFIDKFPQSEYLKAGNFDPKAPPEDFLREIDRLTGMTDQTRQWYRRNENLMRLGELPVPFAVRAKYLLNICDFLHLWELSKHTSKDDCQYHLVMALGRYKYVDVNKLKGQVPLLDEVSLFVLSDLRLLKKIFKVFPRVAIAKSTLARVQNWGQNIFVSSFSQKAREIAEFLSKNIGKLLQPSCEYSSPVSMDFRDIDGYKKLVSDKGFFFYSDCAFTRLYVCGEKEKTDSVTTMDIIKLLRDTKEIKPIEGAKIIAKLSKWNVIGVKIDYIDDILTVLKPSFEGQERYGIEEAIKILDNNEDFNALIGGMWFFDRDYSSSVADIGRFIGLMVRKERRLKVEFHIIAAIWHKWYEKICLNFKGERNKLYYFARSFVSASINLSLALQDKSKFPEYSSQIWSIYKDVVNFAFSRDMNEEVEQEMFTTPAKLITEIDKLSVRSTAYQFISTGILDGTSDNDLFSKAYLEASLKQSQRRGKS